MRSQCSGSLDGNPAASESLTVAVDFRDLDAGVEDPWCQADDAVIIDVFMAGEHHG